MSISRTINAIPARQVRLENILGDSLFASTKKTSQPSKFRIILTHFLSEKELTDTLSDENTSREGGDR